jgi:hypothetical protein
MPSSRTYVYPVQIGASARSTARGTCVPPHTRKIILAPHYWHVQKVARPYSMMFQAQIELYRDSPIQASLRSEIHKLHEQQSLCASGGSDKVKVTPYVCNF